MTAEFSRAPLHCKLRVLSGVSVDTWVIIGKSGVGKDIVENQLLKEMTTPQSLMFGKYSLFYSEKAMAPRSSTLAWKITWTEEPGRLQSMGSPRVGHD